jgi:hypothetical protein
VTLPIICKEPTMTAIDRLTIETPDPDAAEAFTLAAFGDGLPLRYAPSQTPTSGFRGFTIGLDVAGPSNVDRVFSRAVAAGATGIKAPKKQFWGGYSGVLRSTDGTVWKIATTAKKDAVGVDDHIQRVVLLLGVVDVKATKQFYVDHGLGVAKSYGGKYVEFAAGSGNVTLGLYKRAGLAKEFGVNPDGSGPHGLAISGGAGTFTDPDGFDWRPVNARHG